jgi:hypothetical protein
VSLVAFDVVRSVVHVLPLRDCQVKVPNVFAVTENVDDCPGQIEVDAGDEIEGSGLTVTGCTPL